MRNLIRKQKNRFAIIYIFLLFIFLLIVAFPSLFYPPLSDHYEMFYFFHHLDELPKLPASFQWLHILNLDPFEQMRYQPLSHLFYYILHLLFGSNFTFFNIFNFLFYVLSIILLYKFAVTFSVSRRLALAFIGVFAFLFSHFDIVLWNCHIYVIAGFCMFMVGFLSYIKFLKTGYTFLLLWAIVSFILGMLCYEPFALWPFGIIFLNSIKDLRKVNKGRATNALWLVLGAIYAFYFSFYLFTRLLGTYETPGLYLSNFLKLESFGASSILVLFNILYNRIILNICPLLAFPLRVTENIYLAGPVINYIQTNHGIVFIGGGLVGILLISSFIYLYRKRYFEQLKVLAFLFFLMLSYTGILFFCRLASNKFVYSLTEFRYQYVPNALFILILLFVIGRFFTFSKTRKRILYSALIILLILKTF